MSKKIYIIGSAPTKYTDDLVSAGHAVYGLRVNCSFDTTGDDWEFKRNNTLRSDMLDSDEVHVFWDRYNGQVKFELGMAFMLQELRRRGYDELIIKYIYGEPSPDVAEYERLLRHVSKA